MSESDSSAGVWRSMLNRFVARWRGGSSGDVESRHSTACEPLEPRLLLSASPFVQSDDPAGLIVLEAEVNHGVVATTTHDWTLTTDRAGYFGDGALVSSPDIGAKHNRDYDTDSPRVDWQVDFRQTGTHYLWVRGLSAGGRGDTMHFGLDGQTIDSADRHINRDRTDDWTWSQSSMDGDVLTIDVATTGVHTLNAWMREDGFAFDRLVMTTDANYDPASVLQEPDDPGQPADPVFIETNLLVGPPFRQSDAGQGLIVVEAENNHGVTATPTHDWTLTTSDPGYVGSGALVASPDNGTNNNTGYTTDSPRIDWQIDFVETGTHYLWVRGLADGGPGDSAHFGLDGQEVATADRHRNSDRSGDWTWSNASMDGAVLTIEITTPGLHTLNAWMREDGFAIDRVLLTTDAGYTPTGDGPAESTTDSGSISGSVWADLNADGIRDPGEPGMPGITVYLDDNDNGQLDWTDGNGNGVWDGGEGERWLRSESDSIATPEQDETGGYVFDGLAAGDYSLIVQADSWQEVTTAYGMAWANPPIRTDVAVAPIVYRGLRFASAIAESDGRLLSTAVLPPSPGYVEGGGAFIMHATSDGYRPEAELRVPDGYGVDRVDPNFAAMTSDWAALSGWEDQVDYDGPAVSLFRREGSQWTFDSVIRPTGVELTTASNWKTSAIAMSDRWMVITSIWSQQAWVYELQGDTWIEQSEITPTGLLSNDEFGEMVAMDENTIVIGAPGENDQFSNEGALYVYELVDGVWTQTGKLEHINAGQGQLGTSIDVQGDLIVSGGPTRSGSSYKGYAYVYRKTADQGWQFEQRLESPTGQGGDNMGLSVAIVEDAIAVLARRVSANNYLGATHLFEHDGNAWNQTRQLIVNDLTGTGSSMTLLAVDQALLIGGLAYHEQAATVGGIFVYEPDAQGYQRVISLGVDEALNVEDIGVTQVKPTIQLLPQSDTGVDPTDRLTRYNNADSLSRLTFRISGVAAGSLITLLTEEGVAIGSAVASDTWADVVTDGSTTFTDGLHYVEAEISLPGFGQWNVEQWVDLLVDTAAPLVTYVPQTTVALSPTFSGEVDQPDTRVSVTVEDYTVDAKVNGAGDWVVHAGDLAPLTLGAHDVSVLAIDAAGNETEVLIPDGLEAVEAGSIEGVVWRDADADGSRDVSEPGLASVVVYLDLNHDGALSEGEPWLLTQDDQPGTGVDETGLFAFSNLPEGEYDLRVDTSDTDYRVTVPGTLADQWASQSYLRTLTAPSSGSYQGFGNSLSASEHVLVVGSYFYSASYYHGSAGIYTRGSYDEPWELATYLDEAPLGVARTYLGYDVVANDEFVIISSSGDRELNDSGVGASAGAFYVYEPDPVSGQWVQRAKVTGDLDEVRRFGVSIEADDHTMVVGGSGGTGNPGGAYIYNRDDSVAEGWSKVAYLSPNEAATANASFGQTVALDTDVIVIGAPRDEEFGRFSGAVYVYVRDSTDPDQWDFVQKIAPPTAPAGADFGKQLAMLDGAIIVGDGDHIYIYEPDSSDLDSWSLVAEPNISEITSIYSIAVSTDILLINGSNQSLVIERHADGPDSWIPVQTQPGYRQAIIDGRHLIVGNPGAGDDYQGNVEIYELNGSSPWHEISLAPGQGFTGADFGVSRPSRQLDAPVLRPSSDTGIDDTDNITRRNNADSTNVLEFDVYGADHQSMISLYADGILIGQGIATDQPYTSISTDGLNLLLDGVYAITAVQRSPGQDDSPPLPSLSITIDTTTPTPTVDALVTADTTPALTGTISEPGASVRVSIDGTTFYQAVNHGDGTWTLADDVLPELALGDVSLYVATSDAAGNGNVFFVAGALTVVPVPTIAIFDAEIVEGDDGSTYLEFYVDLEGTMVDDALFEISYNSGTALAGVDFRDNVINGQYLTAGQTPDDGFFSIEIFGDRFIEPDETLIATIEVKYGTLEIIRNDALGLIVNDDIETFTSTIAGTVWSDHDADGLRDPGEPGLAGVTVFLDDDFSETLDWTDSNTNGIWDPGEGERWVVSRDDDPLTTGVDETGAYAFDGLASEDYLVLHVGLPGYEITYPGRWVMIGADETIDGQDLAQSDGSPPRVLASSISEGDGIDGAAEQLAWSVTFNEPMDAAQLRAALRSVNGNTPAPYVYEVVDATDYDPETGVATFEFTGSLSENDYQLWLSDYNAVDLAGNRLDGEATWPLPVEGSGDGVAGGAFVVNFSADRVATEAVDRFLRVTPFGSLIAESRDIFGTLFNATDSDPFSVRLVDGQRLTVVATPTDPAATLRIEGLDAIIGAPAPGEPVTRSFAFASANPSGDVWFAVRGDMATAYTLDLYLNAEIEVVDGDPANPVPVDGSLIPVGTTGSRWGAVGELTFDDVDTFDADIAVAPTNAGGRSLQSFSPLGQTFRPVESSIDAVQFYLYGSSNGTSQAYVNLRQGGITGSIVATSDTVTLPGSPFQWMTFTLDAQGLDLAQDYTLELVATPESSNILVGFTGDLYPDGGGWTNGTNSVNDYLFRIGSPAVDEGDAYSLDLTGRAGESLEIVFDRIGGMDAGDSVVLLGPDGSPLAVATATPLGDDPDNYDLSIVNFTVPTDGVYTIVVRGTAEGEYSLLVTANAALEIEANDTPSANARPLPTGGEAMGHLLSVGQGIYGLYSTFNQAANQIVQIDPATGLVDRVVVNETPAIGSSFSALAFDGSQLYALSNNIVGGATIYVFDAESGAWLDDYEITIPTGYAYGLTVVGDALVTGIYSNGNLYRFDKTDGTPLATWENAYPNESLRDLVYAPDRGSVFVASYSRIDEVDAVTGQHIGEVPVSSGAIVRPEGIAYRSGLLYVSSRLSSPAGNAGAGGLVVLDPDTGDIIDQIGAQGSYFDELAGAGPAPVPYVLPSIGSPFIEGGDLWTVNLQPGDAINLSTVTPFDDTDALPGNTLDTALVIYGPDGTVVAADADSAGDSRNASLSFTATVGGEYTVQIVAESGRGEYVLSHDLIPGPTTVVGRHLFYNDSFFDGADATINAADDAAIAPDKAALLAGQTADFGHYSNDNAGITGIMIDIANLGDADALTVADFGFRVGNDADPSGWTDGPSPTAVAVRKGAGVGGSDRVALVWSDGAIVNQWLQVRVLSNATTGLAQEDVFYFGNAVGETGDTPSDATVTEADADGTRDHQTGFSYATVDNRYDFNRDGRVSLPDIAIAKAQIEAGTSLVLFQAPV